MQASPISTCSDARYRPDGAQRRTVLAHGSAVVDAVRMIRDANESDVPAILAIYNAVLATSTAIFSELPATLDDRLQWFRTRRDVGYPILVATDDSGVLGYATFGDFR